MSRVATGGSGGRTYYRCRRTSSETELGIVPGLDCAVSLPGDLSVQPSTRTGRVLGGAEGTERVSLAVSGYPGR